MDNEEHGVNKVQGIEGLKVDGSSDCVVIMVPFQKRMLKNINIMTVVRISIAIHLS